MDLLLIWVVALILVLSATDKALHYQGFVQALKNYVLVPAHSSELLAPVVILLEVFLGVCLVLPRTRTQAAVGAGGLFLFFSIILASNRLLGGNGVCGCWFTITLAEGATLHVVFNLLLCVLCAFIFRAAVTRFSPAVRSCLEHPSKDASRIPEERSEP